MLRNTFPMVIHIFIQEHGTEIVLKVKEQSDLRRQLVRSIKLLLVFMFLTKRWKMIHSRNIVYQ